MNPYDILGIPQNSSKSTAKTKYRKVAMIHHPDKGGDPEQFKKIKGAWELIESGKFVGEETSPVSTKRPTHTSPASWSKPEDVGWASRSYDIPTFWQHRPKNNKAPGNNSQQAKTPKPQKRAEWKFSKNPEDIIFSPKLTANEKNKTPLLGEYTVNITPKAALTGFSHSIVVDDIKHEIVFEGGVPHNFSKIIEIDRGHITIQVKILHDRLKFIDYLIAKRENTIINGAVTPVVRTGELEIDVHVHPEENSVIIEESGGEFLQVAIPSDHDRSKPLFVLGFGHYDWFPQFNKPGAVRGNLRINFT